MMTTKDDASGVMRNAGQTAPVTGPMMPSMDDVALFAKTDRALNVVERVARKQILGAYKDGD